MKFFLVFAGCLFFASSHAADIFKWTDSKGVVHYGENLPQDRKEPVKSLDVRHSNLTDEQRSDGARRLVANRSKLNTKHTSDDESAVAPTNPASNVKTTSVGSVSPTKPSTTSSICSDVWKKYEAQYECMNPYRIFSGNGKNMVLPEGLVACGAPIQQPSTPYCQ